MIKIKSIETKEELKEVMGLDLKLLEFEAKKNPEDLKMPYTDEIKKYERDFFEKRFEERNSGKTIFLLAKDRNKIIGYGLGWVNNIDLNHKKNPEGYICNVFVSKEYRGKRIGKLITDKMVEFFRKKGIQRVVLDIMAKNDVGMKFWKNYGFNLHPFRKMCIDI